MPNIRSLIIKAIVADAIARHDIKQMKPVINVLTKLGAHGYSMAKHLMKLLVTVEFIAAHPLVAIKRLIKRAAIWKRNEPLTNTKANKYKVELVYDIPKVVWDEIID